MELVSKIMVIQCLVLDKKLHVQLIVVISLQDLQQLLSGACKYSSGHPIVNAA